MKTILTVLKKELRRFFTDSRMLVSIFFPGILIYLIYSLLGGVVTDFTTKEITNYTIYIENEPTESVEISNMFAIPSWTVNKNDEKLTKDEILFKIKEGTVDLYIIYEEDFVDKIQADSGVPYVAIYYNSTVDSSLALYNYTITYLDVFETNLATHLSASEP